MEDAVRNVYFKPENRVVLRTADVYQTEVDMGVEGYSDTLLSVVANFRNGGRPEGFNAQSMAGKSKRGEVACRLFAVVNPATRVIERAGFKTRGCLAMTACASMACTMIEGRTLEGALAIGIEDIRAALDGVPASKSNTLYFAVCAIRGLVGDFLAREGGSLDEVDAVVPCDSYSVSCMMCEHCSLRDMRIDMLVDGMSRAEDEAAQRELAENNALALVFDDVRRQSSDSELVAPARWEELGLVPEHMTSEDFEMFVYGYLEDWRAANDPDDEALSASVAHAPASVPASSATHTYSKYASRAVGVPTLFAKKREQPSDDSAAPEDGSGSGKPAAARSEADVPDDDSIDFVDAAAACPAADSDDPFLGLTVPAGYELREIEGEWTLVQVDDNPPTPRLEVNPADIKALVGAHSYYLYDAKAMTDTYANWAFLAAEDNPLVTFAFCVREDSRVYPRPMPAQSLKNAPFRMSDEEIERAWQLSREHADYDDIVRIEASNKDVYFYSTIYLSAARAQALAEWDAVERYRNV